MEVDVQFLPMGPPSEFLSSRAVVVIDVLRATSVIVHAISRGAMEIVPVITVDEAFRLAKTFPAGTTLLGGERGSRKILGFDFGNSPFNYMGEHMKGKTIVLTTTNGTQAIEAAKDAYKIVIGSFLNIDALCEWLINENRNILLLCSGWKNKFNLEDAVFAGAVTDEISKRSDKYDFGDACLALKYLSQMAKKNPNKFLTESSHKERLAKLNLKEDVRYCLTPNQTKVIPVYKDGALVRLR